MYFLNHNDINYRIEDMGSLAKSLQIKEVAIDGNPVTMIGESVSFLVAYLPNLQIISAVQITEQMRRAAMAWRTSKEQSNSAFLDLSTQVCINVQREEVISNAKTNWELLRSQTRCFASGASKQKSIKSDHIQGLKLQNSNKLETVKFKSLSKAKSKVFGSLTSINENVEAKKTDLKKRSNSSDNIIRPDSTRKINPLEFKLPPILVPIIHNITQNKKNECFESKKGTFIENNSAELSSDSDCESSESHESLKSGLRNHLINSNNRPSSFDCEINGLYKKLNESALVLALDLVKNDIRGNAQCNKESEKKKGFFNRTIKSFLDQENLVDCLVKPVASCPRLDSLNSKASSSLDSSKSVLSDSSSSSQSRTNTEMFLDCDYEKSRVKSAQVKKIVHYKSNRAATARAKHCAIPPPSPSPQPIPLKEREQGIIKSKIRLSCRKFIEGI